MRLSVLCVVALFVINLSLRAEDTATVRAADGFELPVGPGGTGEGYYIARGYRPNGHLGEDWNGVRGGNTDLGDPVYATANGFVMFARNYHVGWGNVVILRHAYYEGSTVKYVDSLYGHLLEFFVQEGEQVRRGQKIGRIGDNFGMYEAHLHFEIRKNLEIGMFRSSFARDFTNYYTPNEFVAAHRACPQGNRMVNIPINTYPPVAPPVLAGPHLETPMSGPPPAGAPSRFARITPLPPLTPVPTPAPTPVAKPITKIATPAPATPEPKVAKAPPPTPTPAPIAKSSKTEDATPAPVGKNSKKSLSSTSVAAASPTPSTSTKSTKTTAAASTPAPTKKGAKSPLPVVTAPITTPTPAPVAASKTHRAPAASPTPPPAGITKAETDPLFSDPILPAPTTKDVTPIRRAGSGYKVDRFEDLRGKPGY